MFKNESSYLNSIDYLDSQVDFNYYFNGYDDLYAELEDGYSDEVTIDDDHYTYDFDSFKDTYYSYSYDWNNVTITTFDYDQHKEVTVTECPSTQIYFLNIEGTDYIVTPTKMFTFTEGENMYDSNNELCFSDVEGNCYTLVLG